MRASARSAGSVADRVARRDSSASLREDALGSLSHDNGDPLDRPDTIHMSIRAEPVAPGWLLPLRVAELRKVAENDPSLPGRARRNIRILAI